MGLEIDANAVETASLIGIAQCSMRHTHAHSIGETGKFQVSRCAEGYADSASNSRRSVLAKVAVVTRRSGTTKMVSSPAIVPSTLSSRD